MRGRLCSRPVASVVEEVKQLAADGVKEINIIAQDTTSYGVDLAGRSLLPDLLRELVKIDGVRWIRLFYLYPSYFTDELMNLIVEEEKICPYVDLPLQHISQSVLKRMNRRDSEEDLRNLMKKLCSHGRKLTLRSTFIVGFPGETEEMFCQTLGLLKRVQYDMAYTFIYSPRTGTPAAKMEHQIPQEEKSRRLQRLMDVQNVYSLQLNQAMEHKEYEVIVEGPTKNDENHWFGRTTGNKMIIWEHDGSADVGDTVKVAVDKGQTWVLKGHLIH